MILSTYRSPKGVTGERSSFYRLRMRFITPQAHGKSTFIGVTCKSYLDYQALTPQKL